MQPDPTHGCRATGAPPARPCSRARKPFLVRSGVTGKGRAHARTAAGRREQEEHHVAQIGARWPLKGQGRTPMLRPDCKERSRGPGWASLASVDERPRAVKASPRAA